MASRCKSCAKIKADLQAKIYQASRPQVSLPPYLVKYKYERVIKKILLRKFGYIYLSKTHGKILPSVARKWYLNKLLRKCFRRWLGAWYDEKLSWKLLLRAQVHYDFKTKQNCFNAWRIYIVNRKNRSVLHMFISSYYEKKLKYTYFNNLKCFLIMTKRKRLLMNQVCIQYTSMYQILYFNELLLWMHNLQEKYFYNIITSTHAKNKLLLKYFNLLKMNNVQYKYKIQLKIKANNFFKTKHQIEDYRYVFNNWKIFINNKNEEKVKIFKAKQMYNLKIKYKVFHLLFDYAKYKINTRIEHQKADKYYRVKILMKIIKCWVKYTQESRNMKIWINWANDYYAEKLKKNLFLNWIAYYKRNAEITRKVNFILNERNKKILQYSIICLKVFTMRKQKKRFTIHFYNIKILKKYFLYLKRYKMEMQEQFRKNLIKAEEHYEEKIYNLMIVCFSKLIEYRHIQIKIKMNLENFINERNKNILHHYLLYWTQWSKQKILKKNKLILATRYYDVQIVRCTFKSLTIYVKNEKYIKDKLKTAKDMFKKFTINLACEQMLYSATTKMAVKYEKLLESRREIFFIKLLYLKKWKQAVWNEEKHRSNVEKKGTLTMYDEYNFNVQLLKPKIPVYFKDYVQI